MTSATAGLARSNASWTLIPAAPAMLGNARRTASAVYLRTTRILNLGRPQKEGSRGEAPWSLVGLRERPVSYFRMDIASMAFAFAESMLPALQAASASRTSFAASALEALAPATARGASVF